MNLKNIYINQLLFAWLMDYTRGHIVKTTIRLLGLIFLICCVGLAFSLIFSSILFIAIFGNVITNIIKIFFWGYIIYSITYLILYSKIMAYTPIAQRLREKEGGQLKIWLTTYKTSIFEEKVFLTLKKWCYLICGKLIKLYKVVIKKSDWYERGQDDKIEL